ncbi:MAG TPA: IclR family transcriptional regulator [Steroidobacteraceae bacterium]|nr:IclR family transcriptional regulator [Steroidobacteraceae bacterium]
MNRTGSLRSGRTTAASAVPPDLSHRVRDTGDRQFVAALARGLSILRCFRFGDRYLGNLELSRRTGLPKPTVSRLTYTLTKMGFLFRSPVQEEYALGAGALVLGHAYLAALQIRAVARPMLQELADFARATVMLGENDGPRMVIVEVCHGSPTYQLRMEIGQRVPHNSTALGRAQLAAMTPAQRTARLEEIGKALSAQERADLETNIEAALLEYDRRGFVHSCGDWHPDFFAAGAPLRSADGTRILALSVSGPAFEMSRKRLTTEIGPRLVATRDAIYQAVKGFF